MGEVVTKFTGDTKDLEAAYARLQKETMKQGEELGKLKKAGKDAGDSIKGSMTGAVGELKNMAMGLFTVQTAVGAAKSVYDDWSRTIDTLAAKHKEFEGNLVRTLSKTGDLAKADQINKFFGSQSGITREQMRASFESVSGATPASSLPRRKAIASSIAGLAPTGIDLTQAGAVGGELSDMMPGKSAGDIGDIVAKLRSQTGSDFAKFAEAGTLRAMQSLVTSGAVKTPEEAMGLGIAAHDASLKPDILSTLAEASAKKFDRGEVKTNAMAQFAKANPSDRLAMLRSNPEIAKQVLGDDAGLKFSMMPAGAAAARTQELFAAQTGNYAQQAVGELGLSEAGLKAQMAQNTEVQGDARSQSRWSVARGYSKDIGEILKNAGVNQIESLAAPKMYEAQIAGGADPELAAISRLAQALNWTRGQGQDYIVDQIRILEKIEANQQKSININAHIE